MRKYKSKIAAAVHETMQDARDAGVIDKRTMRHFDESCLTPSARLIERPIGTELEGFRARASQFDEQSAAFPDGLMWLPTSAANGLQKSARSAALERYDAARKARRILMTGGAEHACCRACCVPVWGAAKFAFCQPVQIDDEGSL